MSLFSRGSRASRWLRQFVIGCLVVPPSCMIGVGLGFLMVEVTRSTARSAARNQVTFLTNGRIDESREGEQRNYIVSFKETEKPAELRRRTVDGRFDIRVEGVVIAVGRKGIDYVFLDPKQFKAAYPDLASSIPDFARGSGYCAEHISNDEKAERPCRSYGCTSGCKFSESNLRDDVFEKMAMKDRYELDMRDVKLNRCLCK